LKVIASISITQDVPCGGYLIGFNLVWVYAYVHTYMYGEGKGESKLYVLCSCLSTGLIMFNDQSGPN